MKDYRPIGLSGGPIQSSELCTAPDEDGLHLKGSPSTSKRKVLCIIALGILSFHLIAEKLDLFSKMASSPPSRRPIYSDPIDLRNKGLTIWKVPRQLWSYKDGDAELSLVVNLNGMPEIPLGRAQLMLRLKLSAYGTRFGEARENRLVKNDYYQTDEPFSNAGSGLWEGGGRGKLEYGLAGIRVRPDEDLIIEVTVTTPDPSLALGNPRLKLVAHHDSAALPIKYLILDNLETISLILSLVLLGMLVFLAWGRK